MSLNAADEAPIKALSRSHVVDTAAGLKRFVNRAMWVGKTNRYAHDVIDRLKSDHPLSPERQRNLAQYIAASVVLHANDSWGYLGRSVACLMAGDAHRALHMAYYSELRAAISLLAGTGVGIFDHQHFVVNGVNRTSRLQSKRGTHQVAWDALEYWSNQPSSGALFSSLIRPEGRPLDDWFQPLGGGATLAPQAQAWFMQWGMDLRLAISDRTARNESSYRPDGIPHSWIISPEATLEFVQDLWSTLEPSTLSAFEGIDQSILRLAVENYFRGTTGDEPSADNPGFIATVDVVTRAQGLSQTAETRWRHFLLREVAHSDPQIFANSALEPGDPTTDHRAVISRAVLLLRIATGSARDLLNRAGFEPSSLEFWSRAIGEARGLWNPASPPETLLDLWADVKDAIELIEAVGPTALRSVNEAARQLGDRLSVLCSYERVGLWGLCPI